MSLPVADTLCYDLQHINIRGDHEREMVGVHSGAPTSTRLETCAMTSFMLTAGYISAHPDSVPLPQRCHTDTHNGLLTCCVGRDMSADCNCGLVDQLVKDVADVLRELIAYDVRMVRVVVRRRPKRVYRGGELQRRMSEKEHRTNC